MAKPPQDPKAQAKESVGAATDAPAGLKSTLAQWISRIGASQVAPERVDPSIGRFGRLANRIGRGAVADETEQWEEWNTLAQNPASLLGTENRGFRSRQQIYQIWQDMGADPIISSALRMHVTSALGGHETRGEMVFIEPTAEIKGDAKLEALVASLTADLQGLLNRIAPTSCFLACQFGDSYGRIYSEPGVGVRDVYVDELVLPPLIQAFERANITAGFVVSSGPRMLERLSVAQMARMRMPRMLYVPQDRVTWKFWRATLKTDKIEDLPILPGLAGGSFLDGAEKAYSQFAAAWAGLTGQRVRDSIKQTLVTVQQDTMTKTQRKTLMQSLKAAFEATNNYITSVVAGGRAPMTELFHFLPVFGEKQMVQLAERAGASATGSALTIDDVMMNARFLAGALGIDLSMLGFSDQLAGGLGDGGFFRTSAQAAERARIIRAAFTDFANHIIRVHLVQKHGLDFGEAMPWKIEFAGGISAYETEQARTRADKMNATALAVQTFAQMKDLGLDAAAMENIMTTMMGMDLTQAQLLSKALESAIKKAADAQGAGGMGGGGGGFGMGPGGPQNPDDDGIVPAEG
jgi:hypothetical protein